MHTITCIKCNEDEELEGEAQPGQNQSHYICIDCQSAYDKSVQKAMLAAKAPTVSLDGRAARGATPTGKGK